MRPDDIDNRFTYHPPDQQRVVKHEMVREICKGLAYSLDFILPEGREKALAITHLEEVMFWSNAAIARMGDE